MLQICSALFNIYIYHIDSLVQDCSNFIANALELLALSHCFILTFIPWWQYHHSISVYMEASNINNKKYRNDHMLHLLICVLLVLCYYIDGLMQEMHNSSALAMEWRLSCTNPLIWAIPSIYSFRNLGQCSFRKWLIAWWHHVII